MNAPLWTIETNNSAGYPTGRVNDTNKSRAVERAHELMSWLPRSELSRLATKKGIVQ